MNARLNTTALAPAPDQPRDLYHSDEWQKIKAIAVYAETCSIEAASRESGMTSSAVQSLVYSDHVIPLLEKLRNQLKERFAWQYMELSALALQRLRDALENGEERLTRSGNVVTVMPSAKDCAHIVAVLQDRALAVGAALDTRSNDAALATLADKLLERMAKRADSQMDNDSPPPSTPSAPLGGSPYVG